MPRRATFARIAAAALLAVLAACGDDEPTPIPGDTDATADTDDGSAGDTDTGDTDPDTPDAGGDADPDTADVDSGEPDAPEDTAPDTPDDSDTSEPDADADDAGGDADASDADAADVDADVDAADVDADVDDADVDADDADAADVEIDVAPPPNCGDGILDLDEECDDGNDDETDECLSNCRISRCGDGVANRTYGRQLFEEPLVTDFAGYTGYVCDGAATCPAGAGPSTCTVSAIGNAPEHGICQSLGFERATEVTWGGGAGADEDVMHHAYNWECTGFTCVTGVFASYDNDCFTTEMLASITCEGIVGEQCDDGDGNADEADACRTNCTLPFCGDGIVDSDEGCDLGRRFNKDEPDICRRNCAAPTCGDAIVDSDEECDNGEENADAPDACRVACVLPTCMDGIVDTGEECDDGNDVADDGCSNNCLLPGCGDGVVQAELGEECDDANDDPADGCSNLCLLPQCGDGVVQEDNGEECDDGNDDDRDGCRNACTLPTCGDGILSTYPVVHDQPSPLVFGPSGALGRVCNRGASCFGAMCDVSANGAAPEHGICEALGYDQALWVSWGNGEGDQDNPMPHAYNWVCRDFDCGPSENLADRDDCSRSQMLGEIRCFDLFTEECDEGERNSDEPRSLCRTSCLRPHCGDGILDLDLGETCDDGNIIPDDACTNECTLPQCGDGVVQGDEACDDGNDDNTDDCRNDCTLHSCGDGVLADTEECDDGELNAETPDAGCRTDCTYPRCGDGVVDTGEECDDGDTSDRDECTTLCAAARCGDGSRQRINDEACDDGNLTPGDGCDETCQREDGAVVGHVVLLAHDFYQANDDTRTLVGNAVIGLTGASSEVLVMGLDTYADSSSTGEPVNVDAGVRGRAEDLGVTVTIDRTTAMEDPLSVLPDYDVLLVYEAERNTSAMATLGSDWSDALQTFLEGGGVVVVVDSNSGGRSFLNSSGLMGIGTGGGGSSSVAIASAVDDHPLFDDVSDPYSATNATGWVALSEEEVDAEVVAVDPSGRAVVCHREW